MPMHVELARGVIDSEQLRGGGALGAPLHSVAAAPHATTASPLARSGHAAPGNNACDKGMSKLPLTPRRSPRLLFDAIFEG